MRLYARHLGWLHTKNSAKAKQTRGQALGPGASIPPISGSEYVAEIAHDIGLSEITWRDIAAWCEVKHSSLTPWESNAVMVMAREYSSAISEYRDKPAAAPYVAATIDRAKVAVDVRKALRRRR